VKFVARRSVVAIYEEPQADEPPGRGNTREVEVPLVQREQEIHPREVEGYVKRATEGGVGDVVR
jgi:hypothetical protein